MLYPGDYLAPPLTAAWLSQLVAIATANGEGVVQLFHVAPSCPSAAFVNGAIKPVSEASGYTRSSWNGPFDAAPKAAWASVGALRRRFLELTQHSDAVWALFNNETAAGKAGRLLFSASASGTLLCSDLERGRRREKGSAEDQNEMVEVERVDGEPNAIVSLTSNGAFADSLFCGHTLGNASLLDLQTFKTVRTFSPLRSVVPCYPSQTAWSRDPVHSIALHPTQPLLAVGTRYGFVHLFDVRDPACCVSIRAHSDSVAQVAFHPWFSTLLSTGYDGVLRVWCDRERSLVRQYAVGREKGRVRRRIWMRPCLMKARFDSLSAAITGIWWSAELRERCIAMFNIALRCFFQTQGDRGSLLRTLNTSNNSFDQHMQTNTL